MAIICDKLNEKLKQKGYTTYRIRREKLLGESAVQALREGKVPNLTLSTLDRLCCALDCQPGELLEYVATDKKEVGTNTI